MKTARVRSSRDGLLETGLRGNHVNRTENVLSSFALRGRLEKRKHRRFYRTSEIDWVGTVFRRLDSIKHSGNRDMCTPVENQSDRTFGIVANQQDYRLSEIRIAELPAGHQ